MIGKLSVFIQLQREMALGNVFQGYEEGPITFLPTYKYDNGRDVYDTRQVDGQYYYISDTKWWRIFLVKSSVYPVGLTEFCTREIILSFCNMPVQSCIRLITDQVCV